MKEQKSLLLVEDEAIIALYTKKQLEQYGYQVTVIHNGEKAVEHVLKNDEIDLVLMDINLNTKMDGTEAAKCILSVKDIPLIFHSSHTEPEMVNKTEAITNYGYVVKNAGITVLDASIKMAFRLHNANKALQEKTNMFEDVINHMPGFVLWKDRECRFMGCNQNFAEKNGFSEVEDIIGKTDYDLHFTKKEVEGFIKDDKAVMASGIPKLHIREQAHVSHDEVIHFDTTKIPIKDGTGNVYGVLIVALDVTALMAQS